MTQKIISTCNFYPQMGRVLIATTLIYNYDLEIDNEVKIRNEQQNAIARDYLRNFFKNLLASGIIKDSKPSSKLSIQNQTSESPSKSRKPSQLKYLEGQREQVKKVIPQMSEEQYMVEAYKDSSLKDLIPSGKEFNGSVLASTNTKLVGVIIDKIEFNLYTVDSDLMVRVWDLSTSKCLRSYMIETRDDQLAEANSNRVTQD